MRAPDLDLIYERFSDTYQPAASELGGMEKQVDSELPVLLVFPFLFLSLSIPLSPSLHLPCLSVFKRVKIAFVVKRNAQLKTIDGA